MYAPQLHILRLFTFLTYPTQRSLGFQSGLAAQDVYLKPLKTLSGHSPTTALLVAWLVVLLMGLVCAYLVHGEFCDPSYLRAFLKTTRNK